MSQHTLLRRILPLLAAVLLACGCSGGSDETPDLDPALAQGNAQQIRKDYAALASERSAVEGWCG